MLRKGIFHSTRVEKQVGDGILAAALPTSLFERPRDLVDYAMHLHANYT